jgi:hypothetical protein
MSHIQASLQPTLSRRTALKGLGVSLALPMLECTKLAGAADTDVPIRRMLLISNNLGVLPKPFFPQGTGRDYILSPYLEELQEFRHEFTVFSGLSHPGVLGGHSTENCFLTAARGPTLSGFRNQISLDQFAAEKLGPQTRFPTLNLGVNIDRANRSLSWTRDGALLPAQDSPAALFATLFLDGNARQRQRRMRELRLQGSILDTVNEQSRSLSQALGQSDQRRLDQYFSSVRELEQRLALAVEWESQPKPQVDVEPPRDIDDRSWFFEKIALMLSMAQLAFQTDSTRIVTLMIDGYATPAFRINEQTKSLNDYHNLSHHGNVAEKVQQLESVDRRQMGLLHELMKSLSQREDGRQRMLDNTMVLYGSNMGDANTHDNTNLPILLAGGGFQHGQHLSFDATNNKPLSNLFVSMLQHMDLPIDAFGSSTGTIL